MSKYVNNTSNALLRVQVLADTLRDIASAYRQIEQPSMAAKLESISEALDVNCDVIRQEMWNKVND